MKRREYITRDEDEIRKELTELQIHVTRENGTEMPHRNEYDQNFEEGSMWTFIQGNPCSQVLTSMMRAADGRASQNPLRNGW